MFTKGMMMLMAGAAGLLLTIIWIFADSINNRKTAIRLAATVTATDLTVRDITPENPGTLEATETLNLAGKEDTETELL